MLIYQDEKVEYQIAVQAVKDARQLHETVIKKMSFGPETISEVLAFFRHANSLQTALMQLQRDARCYVITHQTETGFAFSSYPEAPMGRSTPTYGELRFDHDRFAWLPHFNTGVKRAI